MTSLSAPGTRLGADYEGQPNRAGLFSSLRDNRPVAAGNLVL